MSGLAVEFRSSACRHYLKQRERAATLHTGANGWKQGWAPGHPDVYLEGAKGGREFKDTEEKQREVGGDSGGARSAETRKEDARRSRRPPKVSALATGLGTTEATLPATDALFWVGLVRV